MKNPTSYYTQMGSGIGRSRAADMLSTAGRYPTAFINTFSALSGLGTLSPAAFAPGVALARGGALLPNYPVPDTGPIRRPAPQVPSVIPSYAPPAGAVGFDQQPLVQITGHYSQTYPNIAGRGLAGFGASFLPNNPAATPASGGRLVPQVVRPPASVTVVPPVVVRPKPPAPPAPVPSAVPAAVPQQPVPSMAAVAARPGLVTGIQSPPASIGPATIHSIGPVPSGIATRVISNPGAAMPPTWPPPVAHPPVPLGIGTGPSGAGATITAPPSIMRAPPIMLGPPKSIGPSGIAPMPVPLPVRTGGGGYVGPGGPPPPASDPGPGVTTLSRPPGIVPVGISLVPPRMMPPVGVSCGNGSVYNAATNSCVCPGGTTGDPVNGCVPFAAQLPGPNGSSVTPPGVITSPPAPPQTDGGSIPVDQGNFVPPSATPVPSSYDTSGGGGGGGGGSVDPNAGGAPVDAGSGVAVIPPATDGNQPSSVLTKVAIGAAALAVLLYLAK